MSKNVKTANGLLKAFLVFNSAIILVPDKFKGIPVIGLLLSTIFYFIVTKSDKKFDYKLLIVSTSFFLMLVVSILYTEDKSYAFKKLETGSSLLVYPVIFALLYNCKEHLSKSFIELLKWVFVITLAFFLVSTFTYYFLTEPYYTFKSTIVHYHTLVDLRIKGYEIHSIYLSMSIGVGILFLIDSIPKVKRINKIYSILFLALFFVFLALLNKKGPILAFAVVGFIYLIKTKLKAKPAIYVVTSIILFVLILAFIPKFKNINRFSELVDLDGLKSNQNTSTSIRLDIFKCSMIQAAKEPIIGYGWGDANSALVDCYEIENPSLLLKNYNSHNQFLSILLSTGIIGLMIFLYYFYYIFKFSNKNKNQLLFFLLLYFGLNMLSENILEREDGVIFFSFFINLFLFNSESKLNESTEN
ncbi:O-antigen ligase family protein [Psychroserpens sp. AS72]|uniref:O-antigen ligase family protein n=1 Tax=Psychroserpens sp. AS72 TaxID=3135775 RepID=UPI00317B54D1